MQGGQRIHIKLADVGLSPLPLALVLQPYFYIPTAARPISRSLSRLMAVFSFCHIVDNFRDVKNIAASLECKLFHYHCT